MINKKIDWVDPYYKYGITKRRKLIIIDVSASAPNFEVSVGGLSDVAAEFKNKKFSRILDFGAGKLRNTLFLLKENFKVWAVEFNETFETSLANRKLEEARKYRGFFYLKYPKDFLKFHKQLDAAILVNVINIVPKPSDRIKILTECAKRLRKNGLLLLMTQYGEPHYRPGVTNRLRLNDGWCYGLHRKYQTFYKEFTIPEIKSLVPANLFRLMKQITSPHHHAFLFQKI
jgi:SAM-dependent methyltransferase